MQQPAPPRRVTIVDVARHAQVSTTTVSKVLRNAYGASPEMRAKVRRAIDELGYRPYAAARGLRGQTYTIGVMLPDIRNPFFPEIIDGITGRLEETDYQVFLGPGGCNGEKAEARVTEAMIDRGMDGIVLVAPVSSRAHLERVASLVPTVVVGRHGHSLVYDTVTDDDMAGASLVVRHLADLGHRRIAHIEHHESDPTRLTEMPNAQRAEGYRQAMRSLGLAEEIDIVSTSYTQQGGFQGAKELLARPNRPTAVFAGADVVAMGVLEAVAEAGLSVPGDISVAGYDNTTFAAFGGISLTSVDQAGREIGGNAARLLLERIADRHKPSVQIKLSPALVPRRTTAPPPRRPGAQGPDSGVQPNG
ncbi:LacI family DNA-binding transcriptional regulator [Streptomyces ipomoeae]|jgi:LacI family transcriptional regulator|uniref:Periplasmic binding protein and sugar binding domain of the LacI family protein n=1 Tax=Streptomyces ipomoeae 91-03 TaxID=698759 RepID=L1KP47_9ACTN|nr:LacI family DNA-binding transcriptional regulator [Streptomyces ipomoeae]EKX62309.1 periplasmic binding protein and sugar binding domain of the LacI family protein [Streptomyces ipomoeae 91-03]MDX2695462.1 LacI family DNA-binding transcriptional regulator [Streptomyces ipomoeae]MDX2823280.1 LacI family DNA-binding transcriptional regulator [Streptomyces ipomoeae]MDX2842017.1 LacI family DNA-binding transcriptional regulator [Streptomyces ipomoeae]MDX2876483.1 LacI family DNA-binding transcr